MQFENKNQELLDKYDEEERQFALIGEALGDNEIPEPLLFDLVQKVSDSFIRDKICIQGTYNGLSKDEYVNGVRQKDPAYIYHLLGTVASIHYQIPMEKGFRKSLQYLLKAANNGMICHNEIADCYSFLGDIDNQILVLNSVPEKFIKHKVYALTKLANIYMGTWKTQNINILEACRCLRKADVLEKKIDKDVSSHQIVY